MGLSILVISNLLSGSVGVRAQSEELVERLAGKHSVLAVSRKPARFPRLLDMVTTAWRSRQQYDVALVDVFSGAAFFWAECACAVLRMARKPYVLGLHGGNLPAFAAARKHRVKRLLASANAVVAPSPYLLNRMKPYRSDMLLIPNALEYPSYRFRLRKAPEPKIVWLRAFHKIYNPVLAVEVMARLRREFPRAKMTMVGPDKHDGSLDATRRRIGELGLSRSISIKGRVPKRAIPDVLTRADIFLNTSTIDNMPVTVAEAMAAGLCIVSTDVGGMPDLIENGKEGILVPSGDADAMAAAVRAVLMERGLAARLSADAAARAQGFDWGVVVPMWEELLKSVSQVHFDAAA